ncbi:cobalamin B12-binding domain-containing protein [Desulfatitalea alkaliphila]|uniref:Cobalamin-dependent protein n=1 Tax=Desulfatitalea alkaliphila TaxID=2929485 RepID=A0AA41UI46_9BACT|nr:cobalamin-dependent protein [Desulfatitalea alkaliphila]MCJ8500370.1 cobalamin-dependent protein [Desulfatitalea alkaliphila]
MVLENENQQDIEADAAARAFEAALLRLDRLTATRLLTAPAGDGNGLQRIERLVLPALERIGQHWEQGGLALSQVYMSGRICEELVEQLLPAATSERGEGPLIALAVLEDHHLLGKRMVHAVMRAAGYAVRDYGRLDAAGLVARVVAEADVDLLMISTLMLASALRVAKVRELLAAAGRRLPIVVGGAPFRLDETLWQEVGATAMGRSASAAPAIIARLTGGAP